MIPIPPKVYKNQCGNSYTDCTPCTNNKYKYEKVDNLMCIQHKPCPQCNNKGYVYFRKHNKKYKCMKCKIDFDCDICGKIDESFES